MAVEIVKISDSLRQDTPPLSKYVNQLSLGAGTAGSTTVPVGANFLEIKYTAGTLFARVDGSTAVVPAATITDGTGSQVILQGETFTVYPGYVISLINATACFVTLSYMGTLS